MEKAIILGNLAHTFPIELLDNIKNIEGVTDADFLFGPHDSYVIAQAEAKEKLTEIALKVRFTEGVASTVTCSVVDKATLNAVRAHSWE